MVAAPPAPVASAHARFLRCPACGGLAGPLGAVDARGHACACGRFRFELAGGVLRALLPARRAALTQFIDEYSRIRAAEGRGSDDPRYYLALPFRDLEGRHAGQWAIRARTFRYFETKILPALGRAPLDVLDLGAGCGWMSYRLALRGHRPVAVDLLTDGRDGLGAARHYFEHGGVTFPLVEAEFERLPYGDGQFDVAIFNSSLHYATSYQQVLGEAKRCLRPSGRIVVLDTPIYRRYEHGDAMRRERHADFERRYGFASDSVPSIEFLHEAAIDELADYLGIRWELHQPWYGIGWRLRPLRARLLGRRPPSRFAILVGSFSAV